MFFPSLVTPRDRFTIAADLRKAANKAEHVGMYSEADRLWALYDRVRAQIMLTESNVLKAA